MANAKDLIWLLCALPAAMCQMAAQVGTCAVLRHRGRRLDFARIELNGFSLIGVDLEETNLSGARFVGTNLSRANLAYADLSRASFTAANLQQAVLHRANLRQATLVSVNLRGANLTGADLSNAEIWNGMRFLPQEKRQTLAPEQVEQLRGANLAEPKLDGADLTGAILVGADLAEADLAEVTLVGARYDSRTRWPAGFDPLEHGAILTP